MVQDLHWFSSLEYLSAATYEYFNTVIEKHYRASSKRKASALQETIQHMSNSLVTTVPPCHVSSTIGSGILHPKSTQAKQYLVRDGISISLHQLKCHCLEKNFVIHHQLEQEFLSVLPRVDIPVLSKVVEEELRSRGLQFLDYDITLTFVKSGYIDSFCTPTLSSYSSIHNKVLYASSNTSNRITKRIFATSSFGSSKFPMHSCVFLRGRADGEDNVDELWFGKTLFLFRISLGSTSFTEDFAFLRFLTCIPPDDDLDATLD
ncbi:MAG: hypothetical protein AAGH46_13130 [Bacteroidota bacterium]